MATFSFSDSAKELFWPTEHVRVRMNVCMCVQGYLPLLYSRLLSNSENLSPPVQNISECKHTPVISVYAAFPEFYKMPFRRTFLICFQVTVSRDHKRRGAGGGGGFRLRLSFCSLYRPNRMLARLNISLEFYSDDLFLFQCLILMSMFLLLYFIISFPCVHISISPTCVLTPRSLISDTPVGYQITPQQVWRVQSGTITGSSAALRLLTTSTKSRIPTAFIHSLTPSLTHVSKRQSPK